MYLRTSKIVTPSSGSAISREAFEPGLSVVDVGERVLVSLECDCLVGVAGFGAVAVGKVLLP